MRNVLRSVVAVVGGYSILALLVMLATSITVRLFRIELDPVSGSALERPSTAFSLVLLLLSLNAAAIAGYATATIAGRKEMAHAAVLGGVIFLLGVGYQLWQFFVSVRTDAVTEPVWFLLLLPALSLPAVLWGGAVRARQIARRAAADG